MSPLILRITLIVCDKWGCNVSIQETNLKNIADAIRAKEASTEPIKASTFPERITAIQTGVDTSDATATDMQIASGKTLYVNGEKITGKLPVLSSPEWDDSMNSAYSICYGAGKFVALSDEEKKCEYSTDGRHWTGVTLPLKAAWRSVCYGAGKFVAVPANTDKSIYSTDGITWTQATLPTKKYWASVCYGDGKFVAVGYGSSIAAYSADGINWTQTTMPNSANWTSVCWGNGKFVAVASNNAAVAYSSDGISWAPGTGLSDKYWSSVCFGQGKFVVVSPYSNKAGYSEDGIKWTTITVSSDVSDCYSVVCYGNGKFVGFGTMEDDDENWYNCFATSKNGKDWNAFNRKQFDGWLFTSICYGKGIFVVNTSASACFYINDSFEKWA